MPARIPGEKTESVIKPAGGDPPLGVIGLEVGGVEVEAKREESDALDRR